MFPLKTTFAGLMAFAAIILFVGAAVAQTEDVNRIPQREDIDDIYKWRVEDMYETIDDWEADYQRLEDGVGKFEQYKGRLGESPQILLECLKLRDSLSIIDNNLYVYAGLKLDEDMRRSEFQELQGRSLTIDAKFSEATSFLQPELLKLDKETIGALLKAEPALELYDFYLEDLMRQKAHILSPEEETILAQASPVTGAPIRIFNLIDNADHRLGVVEDSAGNRIELTYGRYLNILKGTDREMRRIANDTVQESWKKYINTLAATLGTSLQKDLFLTNVRKYNSTLERKLDGDNIPIEVYDNLVKTVSANLESFHKWYSLRKKYFGYDTLFTYDLSVSVVPELEKKYTYDEVVELMTEGLSPLGEKYIEDAKHGLRSGWVDVFETEGKQSGAYSWGTYTAHPYILMNFDSTLNSLFTLTHEMGHALNSYYANQREPFIYHHYTFFTAEIASTCNEALLMKYLINHAKTKEEKMVLLEHYIRQIDGTFFTQAMFSNFEKTIHEYVQNGGATSVDYFRSTYRDIFEKYLGPDVFVGPDNDMGGMKIYHFYRTYYVYQYATGYAAAQALSQKILENQPGALDAYMKFLSTGSSKYPIEILKDAGVDMTSPEPFERTIRLFSALVDELEALLEES